MTEFINKIKQDMFPTFKSIMNVSGEEVTEQEVLKVLFTTFYFVGKSKGVEKIMQDAVVEFINKEYPHLKEDLDKLLILI